MDSTKNRIIISDAKFPVEVGNTIERELPHGKSQLYDVLDPGWVAGADGPDDDMSHWYIKVKIRGAAAHAPMQPAPPS